MLEHARPGNRPLFGDVSNNEHRRSGILGQFAQPGGALAHLRNRPGGRIHVGDVDGLDRVDDQQVRPECGDMVEDGVQTGLGHQVQVCRERRMSPFGDASRAIRPYNPRRPHLDLALGLLARDVQDLELVRHLEGHLQHQRGLADARVAAHQDDRAGDQTAAQYTRKLPYWDRDSILRVPADVRKPAWRRPPAQATRGSLSAGGFIGDDLLDHAVERTALRALPHESGGNASALLADITSVDFWHRPIITFGGDLEPLCYT
jgi:hypothetical protein